MTDEQGEPRTITGYRDRLSARPGDTINFMVSSLDDRPFHADLVRVVSGNRANEYSGVNYERVPAPFAGRFDGVRQATACGSYGIVDTTFDLVHLESFAVALAVMPTAVERGDMSLVTLVGAGTAGTLQLLVNNSGRLAIRYVNCDGTAVFDTALSHPVPLKVWSIVGVCYDARARALQLFQRTEASPANVADVDVHESADVHDVQLPALSVEGCTFAAAPHPSGVTAQHFTGRLDSIRLLSRPSSEDELIDLVRVHEVGERVGVEGCWDFATGIDGAGFHDLSGARRHGTLKNLPTRAVRGVRWTGQEHRWTHRPDHYSAIHFCEYDIYDCEWTPSFSYTVPDNLRSGIYSARLTKGAEVEHIVFFVAPPVGRPTAKIAFLASTATYLAYANDTNVTLMAPLLGGNDAIRPEEHLLLEHPEFGQSLYHRRIDGSGIHFSSYLRPTVNVRPDVRAWGLTADTDIVHWLEHTGLAYDVITDEQLHHDGADLLDGYDVLTTGTHPEYYSQAMRDAVDSFTHRGGRLMYMGGNGFYWKIAHSPAWPAAIELRRAEDGTRAWASQPGEYHHQFDGDLGGMWLRQSLPPQKLVGVGFASQGNVGGLRFRKGPDASNPRAAFAFAGIHGDVIADYRKMKASAMAEETDRADVSLGTPAHALVLASTENPHPSLLRSKEELLIVFPQIVDQEVKADVVFFEVAGGGAVFSTGSIAWSSVLAFNQFDNPTARLTRNMLDRFLDPTPFTPPQVASTVEDLEPEIYRMPPGMGVEQLSYRRIIIESLRKALMTVALPVVLKAKQISMPPLPPPRDRVVIANRPRAASPSRPTQP